MKQEAIIIGQNSSLILGLTRDLGQIGFKIHIVKTNGLFLYECKSKYVKSSRCLNENDCNNFADFLIRNYASKDKRFILPADDIGTLYVDGNISKLAPYFYFPSINLKEGAISIAMDKYYQKRIAIESGFLAAQGWEVKVEGEMFVIPQGIKYPCFVKPVEYDKDRKKLMFKCDNEEQLINKLKSVTSKIPLICEEYITIDKEWAVLGVSTNEGVLVSGIVEAKEMLDGVTSVGYAHYLDPQSEITLTIEKFIKRIGYIGLFDIDLLESDGKMYFCEMNMRLGNSGVAFLKNGVNLVQLLVKSLGGGEKGVNLALPKYKKFSFADERVSYFSYLKNQISFADYKKNIQNVDVRFIKDKQDIKPYLSFCLFVVKAMISKIYKRR